MMIVEALLKPSPHKAHKKVNSSTLLVFILIMMEPFLFVIPIITVYKASIKREKLSVFGDR